MQQTRHAKGYYVRDMAAELVIFVGLQASGKSTFFRERFAADYEHVSKDLFHNNRNRNRRQKKLIVAALEAGRSVVVDNTNPTVEDRRPLVELGREFGARIVGYYFEPAVRGCLARNARREGCRQRPRKTPHDHHSCCRRTSMRRASWTHARPLPQENLP